MIQVETYTRDETVFLMGEAPAEATEASDSLEKRALLEHVNKRKGRR
jgi:hypothetical protein